MTEQDFVIHDMQAIIDDLGDENSALQDKLANATATLVNEWQDGYETGMKEALRRVMRYAVSKMGQDADEELAMLLGERQQDSPDFTLDTEIK